MKIAISIFLLAKAVSPRSFQDSAPTNALTPEEADIYRKLTDKLAKASPPAAATGADPKKKDAPYDILQNYMANMGRINV
jgi:hypothetical protein